MRRGTLAWLATAITTAGLPASCSSSGAGNPPGADAKSDAGGIGTVCSGGPGECGGGTSCLARSEFPASFDGGCDADTNFCSITCKEDLDCAPFGTQYKCKPGCNLLPSTCDTP
ncbi:MAG: hypothetical protein ACLP1X_07960 [Polyangiaceae bacterium]